MGLAHLSRPGLPGAALVLRAAGVGVPLGLLGAPQAQAGAQIEEPLSHAVRTALSAAVADAAPPRLQFDRPDERARHQAWLQRAGERLRRYKSEAHTRQEFLEATWYESRRAGLETELVLGLIQVESAFRKYAISRAGARGYMQVMPFWTRLIGDGEASRLFHLQTNLRFGCTILRHYLDRERGDLFMALGRYNGSRGRAPYPEAVFAARRSWDFGRMP
ncbi:MAG: lytic transglycosylase domain-containing protein [Rubrivivax sp.]